jgi:hypothetical protein
MGFSYTSDFANVSGSVLLGPPTLMILTGSTYKVTGSVALDALTLTTLTGSTYKITGTVGLDAPTLMILTGSTYNVTGNVSIINSASLWVSATIVNSQSLGVTLLNSASLYIANSASFAAVNRCVVTGATPAAGANGSEQNAYYDLNGRQTVTLDQLFAGEDLYANVEAVVLEPLASGSHALAKSMTTSATGEASRVIKATAGRLYEASCYNGGSGTIYLQIHDALSLPVNGTVPNYPPILVLPGAFTFLRPGDNMGLYCSTGITLAVSTTALSLTVGTLTNASSSLCGLYL